MITFKQFFLERAHPIAIVNRFIRKHSTYDHHDKWSPAKKHEYIKLKQAPEHEVDHVVDKMEKVGRRNLKSKRHTFNIKDLHATQPIVHHSDENHFRKKLADKTPSHISVVTHKGKHYIEDGHHSIMAARLRGEKTITARHINLDEH